MIKITLSPEQLTYLQKSLLPTNPDIITRKARIILLLAQGKTVYEVADFFILSTKTVYRYAEEFKTKGVEDFLKITPIPGRPSKLPENIREILSTALMRSPATLINTTHHNWTLDLLQQYLKEIHNISISRSYTGNLLKKFRINTIYSKAVMTSPDPDYIEKRQVVEELKKKWKIRNYPKTPG